MPRTRKPTPIAPDRPVSRSARRRFRRTYIIALSLIAGLAITGQVVVQVALHDQRSNGQIVNQAGLQRMLSQRLTLKAVTFEPEAASAAAELNELRALSRQWTSAHEDLLNRAEDVAYDERSRLALNQLLAQAGRPLARMAEVIETVDPTVGFNAADRGILLANQEVFLPLMDSLVGAFERNGSARVSYLQRVEIALLIITLVVLALEALFVFRPAIAQLEKAMAGLEQRESLIARRLVSLRNLAGGVAHCFNNLLASIQGHAELMRIDARQRRQSTEFIDAQIQDCQRASAIVRQLLEYSGGGYFDKQPVELTAWLHAQKRQLDRQGQGDRLRLVARQPKLTAEVDPKRLASAVEGLVANALEASSDSAELVTLSLEQVVLSEALPTAGPYRVELPPGWYAVISVEDRGVGIDRIKLDHLFDPFFSDKSIGRGLGLASILGIAHGLGGGIVVNSRVGVGSTFSLYLPVVGGSDRARQSGASAARSQMS